MLGNWLLSRSENFRTNQKMCPKSVRNRSQTHPKHVLSMPPKSKKKNLGKNIKSRRTRLESNPVPPDSEAVGQAIGLFWPGDDAPVRIPRHPHRPSRLIFFFDFLKTFLFLIWWGSFDFLFLDRNPKSEIWSHRSPFGLGSKGPEPECPMNPDFSQRVSEISFLPACHP